MFQVSESDEKTTEEKAVTSSQDEDKPEKFFKKRAGTTDYGKLYEDYTAAYLALKLTVDDDVEEFLISSNDDSFGMFDDIVFNFDMVNKKKYNFAFQLKHSTKNLSLRSLDADKGNYSITKYLESYLKCADAVKDYKCILFSNCEFRPKKECLLHLSNGLTLRIIEKDIMPQLEFSNVSQRCYMFETVDTSSKYQAFFENFILCANQPNVHEMKQNLAKMITDMLHDDLPLDGYIKFITEWSISTGLKEKLTKRMMQEVIGLSLLSPHIYACPFQNVSEETVSLQNTISAFEVTIFHQNSKENLINNEGCINNLDMKKLNKINKKYQVNDGQIHCVDNLKNDQLAKLLWLMDLYPLVIFANKSTLKTIEWLKGKKIILLTEDPVKIKQSLEEYRVFQNLSDLQRIDISIGTLTETLQFQIFQNTEAIPLEYLIKQNKDFLKYITTDDLLKIANKTYCISSVKETLPDTYVDRSLSLNLISFTYLENIDKSILVVIDNIVLNDDLRNQLQNFNLIEIETCIKISQNNENTYSTQNLTVQDLYISKQKCSTDDFEKVVFRNPGRKTYHHFRFLDNGNLEWLKTNSPVDNLENFRSVRVVNIEEEVFYRNGTGNNINLVTGDPGMGKSEFLKSLKNNYRIRPLNIILYPKDITALCSCLKIANPFYYKNFVDCILEIKYKTASPLDKRILELFMKDGEVAFFWDALDEISAENLEFITEVISKLPQSCIQWITCRSHLKRKTQRKLKVLARHVSHFDDQQQTIYIRRRLRNISEDLLGKIKTTLRLIGREEILGAPLQLFMLTELFLRNLENNLHFLEQPMSLIDLYQHFLEEKFNVFFRDSANVRSPNTSLGIVLQTFKESFCENYEKVALKILSPDFDVDCTTFLQKIQEQGDCIGFIKQEFDCSPRFTHISYAEYFTATYFFKNYERMDKLYRDCDRKDNLFKELLFSETHNNVRFFFDLLFAKSSPEHKAVLCKDIDSLRQSNRIMDSVDDGGRNVLHLACSWGQRYPNLKVRRENETFFIDDENDTVDTPETLEYVEILTYLLELCNTLKADGLFNYTPLDYADETNCLFAKLKILQKQGKKLFRTTDNTVATIWSLEPSPAEEYDDNKMLNDAAILYYSAKLGYDDAINNCDDVPFIRTENDNLSILHLTIKHHHEHFLSKLLSFDVYKRKINERNELGETLLYKACEYGHGTFIPLLVTHGASTEIERNDGSSILHVACSRGHVNVAEALIAYVYVDTTDNDNVTPLHLACLNKHVKVVKFLTEQQADVDAMDKKGWTALHVACQEGNEEIVEWLLQKGASKNIAADNGWTPLHKASYKGHTRVVQLLIYNDVDVILPSKDGSTALHIACMKGHFDIVRILRTHQNFTNSLDNSNCTPLYKAAQYGFDEIVSFLIQQDDSIYLNAINGRTPLHAACENGHNTVARLLIAKGIDVNATDSEDCTPIHLACANGKTETVQMLIESEADVKLKNSGKWTPLHLACQYGHYEIVKLLLVKNVDIHDCEHGGRSPLHEASRSGSYEIVEELLQQGATVDATDNEGYAPLHLASESGHLPVVEALVRANADVNIRTGKHKTPISLASSNKHDHVVKFLTDYKKKTTIQVI